MNNFKYAEKALYDYPANVRGLKTLQNDLIALKASYDIHTQNYEIPPEQNNKGFDPVFSYVSKILAIEDQIKKIFQEIEPITKLIQDLKQTCEYSTRNREYILLLKYFYFIGGDICLICNKLNMSRSAFYLRRKRLIQMVIKYLGL